MKRFPMNQLLRQFTTLASALIWLTSTSAHSQGSVGNGTFQNLDFEDANPPSGPGLYALASLLPGWSGTVGSVAQSSANFNVFGLDTATLALLGSPAYSAIDGNYSALLESGITPPSQGPPTARVSVSVSQTGTLPAGVQSVQMKIGSGPGVARGAFSVAVGGVTIPMIPLSMNPNYTLYGGNIGAFAGLNEQLSITAAAPLPPNPSFVELDDITFSSQIVPEPATVSLSAIEGFLLIGLFRRTRE